jgi:purine-nucleoside phosphorylase
MNAQNKIQREYLAQLEEARQYITARISIQPHIGLILGSGLNRLVDAVEKPIKIPYTEIPHWPASTVSGHQGALVIGSLAGKPTIVMQGRAHYYEGYTMQQITLPVRVLQRLGMETLIVTNAAGAVNHDYLPGDLMLILDHLNFIGMAGLSPLRGPNLDAFGPRFPDMSQAYDRAYHALARQTAAEEGVLLREGVYACLAGPSFETPADLRFLKLAGVDAVGMSTVPEVTAARHGQVRVLGISGISNKANLDGETVTTHEEVLEAGQMLVPKMVRLIQGVLEKL